jgi:hypothetical protein
LFQSIDLSKAIQLDTANVDAYLKRGVAKIRINKRDEGLNDISIAKAMGGTIKPEEIEIELSVNRSRL